MAELMQLDRAANLVGKSEVTLRRLIKAGKVPFQKEKTLTGFIYMINPDHIKAFYQGREGIIFEEQIQDIEPPSQSHSGAVRVAVAGESGSAFEYWQKKSELYEDKYHQEMVKHSQAREELGVWRGRAEQAQSMLMKLLPPPATEVEINPTPTASPPAVKEKTVSSSWAFVILTSFFLILALAVMAYAYFQAHPLG